MNLDTMFIPLVIIVLIGFWWFGHKSAWGKLHYAFEQPKSSSMSKLLDSYKNISLLNNNKYIGGWGINLYVNKQGVLFDSVTILKHLIPSFFIPWHEINNIELNNTQGFLHSERTKISLINHNISVLIPLGSLTDNLLSYINENNINYGR